MTHFVYIIDRYTGNCDPIMEYQGLDDPARTVSWVKVQTSIAAPNNVVGCKLIPH